MIRRRLVLAVGTASLPVVYASFGHPQQIPYYPGVSRLLRINSPAAPSVILKTINDILNTLNMTSPSAMPQAARNASGPIAFRLEEDLREVLVSRAEELGVSPHLLARHYVTEQLYEAEDRSAARESLTTLQTDLRELRADLALAVEALLVSAGKVPAAEARKWVEESFHPAASAPVP